MAKRPFTLVIMYNNRPNSTGFEVTKPVQSTSVYIS